MDLPFISQLNESSQYRTKTQLSNSNARQIIDLAFLDLMVLWILYSDYTTSVDMINYSRHTIAYGKFSSYRQTATDLYHRLHVISTKRSGLLAAPGKDAALLDRIKYDAPGIKMYLSMLANNKLKMSQARIFFQKTERHFRIDNSNYRSVRRIVQAWDRAGTVEKKLAITRILYAYRAHAHRSDLYLQLMAHAKNHKLIAVAQTDPEGSTKLTYNERKRNK